jgi:DNA invertase Pin-like site-specific DNA recombinase
MTTQTGTGNRIGYKRVSSADQSTLRQLDGMTFRKVFEDHASGKDTNRPGLQAAIEFCREGDTLVIHSMDRASRNLSDLLKLVQDLNAKGISVEFVKENLTFSGDDKPMAKLLLSVMGACSEFERSMIRERQREGINLAVARGGVFKGRVKTLKPERAQELRDRVASGLVSKAAVAREFGITRQTLYEYIKPV